ncbi:MAG TPA: MgtC/SapB family protein [Vicinamibacterales bacterium]|jgi:putative Mg2+ transporter-C (MgtC) family protein
MPRLALTDILLRLGVAVLLGAVLGLDRELKGKPAGPRTMAIVGLGSAVLTIVAIYGTGTNIDAVSRVIQGVITGIGFLGAGTILHKTEGGVRGLTTAATVWLVAALGIASGLAYWPIVIVGTAFGLLLLVLAPAERWIERKFGE